MIKKVEFGSRHVFFLFKQKTAYEIGVTGVQTCALPIFPERAQLRAMAAQEPLELLRGPAAQTAVPVVQDDVMARGRRRQRLHVAPCSKGRTPPGGSAGPCSGSTPDLTYPHPDPLPGGEGGALRLAELRVHHVVLRLGRAARRRARVGTRRRHATLRARRAARGLVHLLGHLV